MKFVILAILLISTNQVLGQETCSSNPLLKSESNPNGLQGLATPKENTKLKYCPYLLAGKSCCSDETIDDFPNKLNELKNSIQAKAKQRDEAIQQAVDKQVVSYEVMKNLSLINVRYNDYYNQLLKYKLNTSDYTVVSNVQDQQQLMTQFEETQPAVENQKDLKGLIRKFINVNRNQQNRRRVLYPQVSGERRFLKSRGGSRGRSRSSRSRSSRSGSKSKSSRSVRSGSFSKGVSYKSSSRSFGTSVKTTTTYTKISYKSKPYKYSIKGYGYSYRPSNWYYSRRYSYYHARIYFLPCTYYGRPYYSYGYRYNYHRCYSNYKDKQYLDFSKLGYVDQQQFILNTVRQQLNDFKNDFASFQQNRALCIVHFLQLKSKFQCMSCQTNSAEFFKNGNMVLNQNACSNLVDSCYDFVQDNQAVSQFTQIQTIEHNTKVMNQTYTILLKYETQIKNAITQIDKANNDQNKNNVLNLYKQLKAELQTQVNSLKKASSKEQAKQIQCTENKCNELCALIFNKLDGVSADQIDNPQVQISQPGSTNRLLQQSNGVVFEQNGYDVDQIQSEQEQEIEFNFDPANIESKIVQKIDSTPSFDLFGQKLIFNGILFIMILYFIY